MKKGQKLTEDGYLLEITNIQNEYVDNPGTYRSLRQAVEGAAEYVQDMDTYGKVHRDFTAMNGSYIGVFFSKPSENPEAKQFHIIVKISAFELLTQAGIDNALAYIERISRKAPNFRRIRSASR